VGDKVQVGQTIVTRKDGRALFEVSDGSSFRVYPNSKVLFRNNSGNWRDLLDVVFGRVRVQIEHPPGQANPQKVRTPSAVISVRGTTFDIDVDEDETTIIEVQEGVVEVRHALLTGQKELKAGESLTVYRQISIAKSKGSKMLDIARIGLDIGAAAAGAPRAGGGSVGGSGGGVGGVGGVGDTNPNGGTPGAPGPTTPVPPTVPVPPTIPTGGVIP
jgi:hypothetical protein